MDTCHSHIDTGGVTGGHKELLRRWTHATATLILAAWLHSDVAQDLGALVTQINIDCYYFMQSVIFTFIHFLTLEIRPLSIVAVCLVVQH